MPIEIEAKILNINVAACRTMLAAQGYTCTRPWSLMRRYTYFLTELNPNPAKWARVRDNGDDTVTMAFKHEHDGTDIHGTEEIEINVDSFENAATLLQKLGFEDRAHQENFRETWIKGDREVTLNEWPGLPPFAEVEGHSEDVVKAACNELGFDYAQALFGGVGRIYEAHPDWAGNKVSAVRELTFAEYQKEVA
ncbi:MAG: adenylyl cyclase [Blastochloris viridis]|uniref:Adenylyl cyclase n=1 Tax=Blastochloris viridis TaxID=1079 RepID=A0A6N4RDC9_BLAVI|nr:MAG: adenylyl cyclase [Blastochloris viridis]